MHKQVCVQLTSNSKFLSKFSRKGLLGISDQKAPPMKNFRFEMTKVYSEIPPTPQWKTSDLRSPKFTLKYPPSPPPIGLKSRRSYVETNLYPPWIPLVQIIYHGQINSTNFTTKNQHGFRWFQLVSSSLYKTSLARTFVPPSTSTLQCFVCLEYLAANISLFPISKTYKQTTLGTDFYKEFSACEHSVFAVGMLSGLLTWVRLLLIKVWSVDFGLFDYFVQNFCTRFHSTNTEVLMLAVLHQMPHDFQSTSFCAPVFTTKFRNKFRKCFFFNKSSGKISWPHSFFWPM